MYIRVLASQIAEYPIWEAIKIAAVTSQAVKEEHQGQFLTGLLHSLMSDMSQCFVKLSEDRKIIAVAITQIQHDKITGEKYLLIQAYHTWEPVSNIDPQKEMAFILEFAQKEGAKHITIETGDHMAIQAALSIGFVEVKRRLDFHV